MLVLVRVTYLISSSSFHLLFLVSVVFLFFAVVIDMIIAVFITGKCGGEKVISIVQAAARTCVECFKLGSLFVLYTWSILHLFFVENFTFFLLTVVLSRIRITVLIIGDGCSYSYSYSWDRWEGDSYSYYIRTYIPGL